MFGNAEPALHAHVIPRFTDEPADKRTAHPWAYDWTDAPQFNDTEFGELRVRIREALAKTQ
jgi:hypothetical protein